MNRSSFVLLVVAAGGAWLLWRRSQPAGLPVRSVSPKNAEPSSGVWAGRKFSAGWDVATIALTPPTQNTDPEPSRVAAVASGFPFRPRRAAGDTVSLSSSAFARIS